MIGQVLMKELTNLLIKVTNFPFVPNHASITPVFNKGYRGSVANLKNYCASILTLFMG